MGLISPWVRIINDMWLFYLGMVILLLVAITAIAIFVHYQKTLSEAKNYERGLKMIMFKIHLPPPTEDIESANRDERDLTEEVLSQTQVMYDIIASTYIKPSFKGRIYGQRHISLEIISKDGLVNYYAVVPGVLKDSVKQAIEAAYPSVRLEEVDSANIFSKIGRSSGTIGGELILKKEFEYPIATYQESKRDAARALLNALSSATKLDGVGIQLLIRPADSSWTEVAHGRVKKIKKSKGQAKGGLDAGSLLTALWKAPETKEPSAEDRQLTSLEQSVVDAIEAKTKYPAFETLIRVVVSSNTATQSQALLRNVVSSFSLFDSPTFNGFKYVSTKDVDELISAYIFRFFPQKVKNNVLNSVELASIYHLPSQRAIPTSQVQRQATKQVDGPTEIMDEGFLLGVNEFRGVKKEIRLATNDRRRHTYFIGQTGTGKSGLLENLAYQDMLDGRGFAFIDPHGDSVDKLLGMVPKERVEDVVYFNPADMDNPVGLNLFEFRTEDQKDFLVQESINILYALYDPNRQGMMGARFEQIFRNVALLLMSGPETGTLIDIPKTLIDAGYRNEKLKYAKDSALIDYWTKEWVEAQRSNDAGEVTSWFASKFGAFLSNTMMRNIIGQTKSGFDFREIMDSKKILLINFSKGLTGELNSKLLGMIFVMKFQAAAMSRADMSEKDREDFCLYVDEFQNFATDSFATILSEARKYRLNLVLANQFMTQLTDNIREAVLGNIGTIISGRVGVTDAEILQKKFQPVFEAEDLTKLPNFQVVTSVMIHDVPSASFTMTLVPPMGQSDPKLRDALKSLSAAKYGRPRAVVEQEINARLASSAGSSVVNLASQQPQMRTDKLATFTPPPDAPKYAKSSFLDEWLAKRKQLSSTGAPSSTDKQSTIGDATKPSTPQLTGPSGEETPTPKPQQTSSARVSTQPMTISPPLEEAVSLPVAEPTVHLDVRGGAADEVAVKLRD